MKKKTQAAVFAVLAAALYAISIPVSKLLMPHVGAVMMAALLYLGAGAGLLLYSVGKRALKVDSRTAPLTRREAPYTVGMVVLDILAPILLMAGVGRTTAANVSLLSNFEIVATTVVALAVFRETVSKRLWAAILLVTAASAILSFEGGGSFVFNRGSVLVLGACVCWGFENNCTKMISDKSPVQIVAIKGCFSGLGSLVIALALGERLPELKYIGMVMALGLVSYGVSISFYIMAQKDLGAAKTSAYYSIAPFLGAGFGMALLGERPGLRFYAALALMAVGALMTARDQIVLQHAHIHTHVHTHEHRHGDVVHTHEHTHVHDHLHVHREDGAEHTHTEEELSDHGHVHNGKGRYAAQR